MSWGVCTIIGLLCVMCCVFYFCLTHKDAEVQVYMNSVVAYMEDQGRATPWTSNLPPHPSLSAFLLPLLVAPSGGTAG